MKICPVCNSNVFDDMDTCFNCLHKFDDVEIPRGESAPLDNFSDPSQTQVMQPLPAHMQTQTTIEQPFAICPSDSNFLESYYAFLGDYLKGRGCRV